MARIINGFVDINGGDVLSSSKKAELVNNINSNLTINSTRKLGYRTTPTNFTRSDVSVVGSAYTTSASARPQILSNGWHVNATGGSNRYIYFNVSKDNGATFQPLAFIDTGSASGNITGFSIEAKGTKVYCVFYDFWAVGLCSVVFDASTVTNINLFSTRTSIYLDSTTGGGTVSTVLNDTKTELHVAYSHKGGSYTNSFNIRYAKGTINGDGSVTWGAVTQVTTANTSGSDYKNPTIVVKSNGNPSVLMDYYNGSAYTIYCTNFSGGSPSGTVIVYQVSTYAQSNPSAIFVPQSINGLANGRIWVAWKGGDATYTSSLMPKFSYSDDGGVTWASVSYITTGIQIGSPTTANVSLTADKNNNIFAIMTTQYTNRIEIGKWNGSGWTISSLTPTTAAFDSSPSALFDLSISCTQPLFIYKGTSKVGFYGTWTEDIEQPANPSIPSNDQVFNTLSTLAGDALTETEKTSLLTQYNSNNTGALSSQLGYLPTYGATTNPSRSNVQVINSAYDTSGNGGRKLVRLSNGTLVNAVKASSTTASVYKSTDNGGTWSKVTDIVFAPSLQDISLVVTSSKVFIIASNGNSAINSYEIDVIGNTFKNGLTIDSSQTALGNVSTTYSPTDNTLHAAWASKNSTTSTVSFNIRYAKGTINGDGSVTWGSVVQVTAYNTSGQNAQNPCIVIRNGRPTILLEWYNGTNYQINCYFVDGSTVSVGGSPTVSTYTQSSPSATVDGNGHIHVVWQGKQASPTQFQLYYSSSTDGGITWSGALRILSSDGNFNTVDQLNPTIGVDTSNKLYVLWQGAGSGYSFENINMITKPFGGSWSNGSSVTNNSASQNMRYPSLCDNLRTFTSPLVIWQDNVSPSVKFSGTWTDTPIIKEEISIDAVSNRVLIDAILARGDIGTAGTKKRQASAVMTSSPTTLVVSGLPFKPAKVIITYYQAPNYGGLIVMTSSSDLQRPDGTTGTDALAFRQQGSASWNPTLMMSNLPNGAMTNNGFSADIGGSSYIRWFAFE